MIVWLPAVLETGRWEEPAVLEVRRWEVQLKLTDRRSPLVARGSASPVAEWQSRIGRTIEFNAHTNAAW